MLRVILLFSKVINLRRKYKVKTVIADLAEKPFGMRSRYDMMSLFVILGMRGKDQGHSKQYLL